MNDFYDVAIIGGGSAGCSASIYATRYNLKTLLVTGPMPGGLITEALDVENYPGFVSVSGVDLAKRFIDQSKALGATHGEFTVDAITFNSASSVYELVSGDEVYTTKSVILAMGTKHKKLNITGEIEFAGRGVSYCATCDGPFFKNKIVAVVGGGNSAVEGAQEIAVHASKVYLIARSELKAAPIYIDHLKSNPRIEIITPVNITKIHGENVVKSVMLDTAFNGSKELLVDGVFVQIGYEPVNNIAKSLGVELTKNGYVKVDASMHTNVKGVFCAGDLNNASNMLHQQVTSAAEGAIAAQSVYRFLNGLETVIEEG